MLTPLAVICRVVCAADGQKTEHDNRYVVRWNPHTRAGFLDLVSTDDPAQAHIFSSASEVLEQRRCVSELQRTRPWDGQPNRPLMAVAVEMVLARTPEGVTRQ